MSFLIELPIVDKVWTVGVKTLDKRFKLLVGTNCGGAGVGLYMVSLL